LSEAAAARLSALATELADPDCDVNALADEEDTLVAARDPELIPHLETHLDAAVAARNGYARHVLARILAETAGRASLPTLLRAFSRDLGDDQDSLSTQLTIFAREDPAAARAVLLPWAGGPDKDLRRAAVWLLGFVPDPADLVLLAGAAEDPDERIRSVVVGTLGSHSRTCPEAVDLLVRLLTDPSPQVRISALSSLGSAQQPRTLPALRALAEDGTAQVRAWVAVALSRFPTADSSPDPETSAVLDRLGADPDAHVRARALDARRRMRRTAHAPRCP
jgi:HEAT repeat protein